MQSWFKSAALAVALASIGSVPAAAQQNTFQEGPFARDSQAVVSFVFPIGGNSQRAEAQPRLEFEIREHRRDDLSFDSFEYRQIRQERSIGFTLQQSPRLMANGGPIASGDKTANLSTAGAIGVAVAATLGALFLLGKGIEDSLDD